MKKQIQIIGKNPLALTMKRILKEQSSSLSEADYLVVIEGQDVQFSTFISNKLIPMERPLPSLYLSCSKPIPQVGGIFPINSPCSLLFFLTVFEKAQQEVNYISGIEIYRKSYKNYLREILRVFRSHH